MSIAISLLLAIQVSPDPWAVLSQADSAYVHDDVPSHVAEWQARLVASADDWAAHLGLGTISLLSYDGDRAFEYFQHLAEDAPEPWGTFGLRGVALAWSGRGNIGAADSVLSVAVGRAASLTDDRLRLDISILLARVHLRTRGPAAGLALLDSLVPSPPDDPRLSASLHCTRAEAVMLSGGTALDDANRGIEAATAAGDLRLRAYCRSMAASLLSNAGLADSAWGVLSGVIDDARAVRDAGREAAALQWRGFLNRSYGFYGAALADLTAAVRQADRAAASGLRGWAALNLAVLYNDLGDHETGVRWAGVAREAFSGLGDRFQLATIAGLDASLLFLAGDYSGALEAHRATRDLADSLGYRDMVIASHIGVAHSAMLTGRSDIAEAEVTRFAHTVGRYGDYAWASAQRYLALVVALHARDLAEARRQLLWASGLDPDDHVWHYHFLMRKAEVEAAEGNLDAASAAAEGAFDALERMRSGMDDRALRLRAFQRSDDLSDPDLGFATIIAAFAKGGHFADAFRLTERSRAGEMLAELARAAAIAGPDTRPGDGGTNVYNAAAVAAALPDSATALVGFVTGMGGESTTAMVLHRDGVVAHELPPIDSLRPTIERLGALLQEGNAATALLESLGRELMGSLAGDPLLANVERLILVPDGALYHVPFAALKLPDGRFLAERWAVSFAPSAAVAMRLWQHSPRAEEVAALLLADPPTGDTLPPLPGARREVRRVSRYAAVATVRQGEQATEAWLKQASLSPYRLVHLATHAIADNVSGMTAGLVLAPGEGEDGLLRPGELAELDLDVDLFVLSACRTASGRVLRGEGLRGLTAPLLEAGARAVVATRWRVEDDAAARFVELFYRELSADRQAADALRQAQAVSIAEGVLPATWAAFTIFGDGSVKIPLETPKSRFMLTVAAVFLLVVGSLYMVFGRRARRRTID